MLEKLLSNQTSELLILTDVKTLREAFTEWGFQEEEKRKTAEGDKLITKQEAAKRLDVTVSTLWRWEKEKYLIPIKVGRRVRYRLKDVLALERGEYLDGLIS